MRFLAMVVAGLCVVVLVVQIGIAWQRVNQLRNDQIQTLRQPLAELSPLFLEVQLALRAAAADAATVDGPSEQLKALRQSYGRFLDHIVGIDRIVRASPQATTITTSGNFEALKTNAVLILPQFRLDDIELSGNLPAIARELDAITPAMNSFIREGNDLLSFEAGTVQTRIMNDLQILVILLASLVASMALLVWDFRRLYLTNRIQAQENRLASARLETVVDTSQDAIIVTDSSERITGFNHAAEMMFGLSSSVAKGRSVADLIYETDGRTIVLNRQFSGRTERMQMMGCDAVGRRFPVEMSLGVAMRDDTLIYVCFIRDISDRIEVEKDLRTSRDKALAGERAKAHFLAVMSHEMRTPLTGILGVIELMRAQTPGANNKDYLDVLHSSGQVLLGQINDVLDLTEIESMGINLTDQPFDLDALIEEVLLTQRPSANRQNSALLFESTPQPLGWFQGDPIRLRQILINLISNAIKFTRDGEILIEVTAEPDTHGLVLGRHSIQIQVADTGMGIPQSEMDRIFEDFVRVDQPASKKTEGTGLGLGIVKRLVAAMGGKLGAESVEGEGSLFWVSLSLKLVDKPAEIGPEMTPDGDMRPASVLLVEDNATNRFILREMLQRDGHQVAEAADGAEAVALATKTAFDLILMDINMPVMNGLQATAEIRAGDGASAKTRIVALTAHVFDHEHLRFQDAGIDDIVMKPLKWDGLRRVLRGDPAMPLNKLRNEKAADKVGEPPLLDKDILGMLLDTLGPRQLARLLDQFLVDGQLAVTGIRQGIRGPRQILRDRLHGFAGPAATFGARRLHSRLGGLEEKVFDMSEEELRYVPRSVETIWIATTREVEQFLNLLSRPPDATDLRNPERIRDSNDPRRMI
jgi:PAS domain S-box-containing protein